MTFPARYIFRVCLFGLLAAGCATPPACLVSETQDTISRYPHFRMAHGDLELWVVDPMSPNAYYQGQRFVRSGMVAQARWRGQTFFAEHIAGTSPVDHDHVGGTAEEFDYHGPASFSSGADRPPFLKIGAGLLRRREGDDPAEPYGHWKAYEWVARPAVRVLRPDDRRIVFEEELVDTAGGLGYAMTSTITLLEDGDGFEIHRVLKNLGREPLTTEHYSHNFLRFGDYPLGSDYQLGWSAPVDWRWIHGEEHGLRVGERSLGFDPPTLREGIYLATDPDHNMDRRVAFSLEHRLPEKTRRLSIDVDRPLWRVVIWGRPDVLSPELFIRMTLDPGETETWTTAYRFTAESETGRP